VVIGKGEMKDKTGREYLMLTSFRTTRDPHVMESGIDAEATRGEAVECEPEHGAMK
jgi:hypothetical protein